MADDSFKLTVRIDTDASKTLMTDDIRTISEYLSKLNDNSGKLKIGVALGNQADNIQQIKRDLRKLQSNAKLPRIKLKVEIDEANLTAQLQRIYNITGNASRKGSTSIDQIIFSGTGTGKSVKQSVDVNKIKIEALKKEARLMFTDLEAAFVRLNDSTSETYKSLSTIGTKIDTTNTVRELNAVVDALKAIAKYVKVAEKSTPTFKDLTSARNNFAKLQKQVSKYSLPVDELNKAHNAMQALANIKTRQDFMASPANIAALQSFVSLLNAANDHYRPLIDSAAQWREEMKLQSNLATAKKSLDNWLNENPNVSQNVKLKAEAENIAELFDSVSNSDELLVATNRLKAFKDQCRAAGAVSKTLSQRFKDILASITFHDVINYAMRSIGTLFRTMVSNVISLDTAMTELKKVTDETDASYRKFLTNAKQEAKNLGVTVSDLVTATADFARLGYNVEDASTLAKAATIYKNVGDGIDDISTASESLISTMQAFGFSADEVLGIVDRFNAVGNSFAISSSGIGAGLLRSASALQTAGNTLEESIALITSANEIVQDPESVGQGLKTIALRIRGAKVELEDAGEEIDGMAESTSKLREQVLGFSGGRLDIMIDADTFKSTYDILAETAELWKELSDIEKAGITELFAGKNRANIFNALMTNWDQAAKAVEVASNAEGSAVAENEKYLESIQGRISKFKAAYESLSDTIMDGNLVKFVVDGGTKIVEVLDKILQIADVLPAALTGTVLAFKSIDASDYMGTGLNPSLLEVLGMEMSLTGNKKSQLIQAAMLNTDKQKINEYNTIIKQFGANSVQAAACADEFSSALKKTQVIASNGCIDMTATTQGLKGLYSQYKATTFATKALATATGFLKGTLMSLGASLVFTAIIKIGQLLWDNVLTTNAARESIEEYSSELKELQNNEKSFKTLAERFDELAHKQSLSMEEWEEYYDIQNQLHDLMPELEGYYNIQGNFIITETDLVEELAGAYDGLIDSKKRAIAKTYTDENILGKSVAKDDWQAYQGLMSDYATAKWARDLFVKESQLKDGEYLSNDDQLTLNSFESTYGSENGAITEMDRIESQMATYADKWAEYISYFVMNDSVVAKKWDLSKKNAFMEILSSMNADQLYTSLLDVAAGDFSLIPAVYGNAAYTDITSGKLDGMSASERSLTIKAGGLDRADALVNEYAKNQEAIREGHYVGTDIIDAETAALAEQLFIVRQIAEVSKAQSEPISLPESQKAIVEDMDTLEEGVKEAASAWEEFKENGEISAKTLGALQEKFGACNTEWSAFLSLVASGKMTTDSLQSSLDSLIGAYIKQKALTGDITEETKSLVVEMLESIGVTNAQTIADEALEKAMTELNAQKMVDTGDYLNQIIDENGKLKIEEGITLDLIVALAKLEWAKIGASTSALANATETEIQKFRTLLGLVGNPALLKGFDSILSMSKEIAALETQEVEQGYFTPEQRAEYERKLKEQKALNDEFNKNLADSESQNTDPDFDYSKYAKDTADKVSEAFQKMYDELQYLRDTNLISEEEYLARLLQLNEQFNKDNLEAYRKYQLEIFNGFKSMLSDRINKEADARIKALKKEREETEKYYDDLIEAEEEKLELLKKEWETEEYLLKIEQARAALQRAQQQKNVRIYKEGQGFVWQADSEEVNAATGEVNQAIQDYQRYLEELAIQERIDALEDAKEQALEIIDEQIEAVEEWKENALEGLEEVGLSMEEFLLFFEEFGINISEGLIAMITMFDQWAEGAVGAVETVQAALAGFGGLSGGIDFSGFGIGAVAQRNVGETNPLDLTAGKIEGVDYPYGGKPLGDNTLPNKGNYVWNGKYWALKQHASGIISSPSTHWALTDEEGPELVIPGQGTFRKLKMGTSILPADISRNLWAIGQNPIGFVSGIANMINNRKEENKTYQVNVGDIILHEVQNARRVADELKGLVLKAEQLAYSK